MYKGGLTVKIEVGIHVVFWILTAYFTFVGNPLYYKFSLPDFFYVSYLIVFISTFYFNYWVVMKRIFNALNWSKLMIGLLASFMFYVISRFLLEQVITEVIFNKSNYVNPTIAGYLIDNLTYSSKPIVLSSFLWLIIHIIRLLEYNKHILEEQKNSEIRFLKAQINPHFIFNTLNNIYSMVYFQSPKSLPAIEKLSNIMRFTTYESQRNLIKLTEELTYIKAYIELEELRHYEKSFVKLDIDLKDESIQIPPYILSPLVENALKHGSYSNETPIEITLFCDELCLEFEVKNKIGNQKKDKLGGIGLENLKNRLEILFPKKYHLTSVNKDDFFLTNLVIQLK